MPVLDAYPSRFNLVFVAVRSSFASGFTECCKALHGLFYQTRSRPKRGHTNTIVFTKKSWLSNSIGIVDQQHWVQ